MESVKSTTQPKLNGLVLAGGQSTRMGFDKSLIAYHGIPQREYLIDILKPFTTQSYLSCQHGQIVQSKTPLIEDTYFDLGPFGAILTAFQKDPESAWLVVACDFPLLDAKAIAQLVSERDLEAVGTSFFDAHSAMPEPWITILEPRIYPILLDYVAKGRSSLRGVLVDHIVKLVYPQNPDVLLNANTPEEAERLRQLLQ